MPPPVVESIPEIRREVAEARRRGRSIAFVPTMGALHEGHARLIEAAASPDRLVVVSIFVNPTQFGPGEDFTRYPRTFDADLAVCGRSGADVVFAPEVATLYPPGPPSTFVEVPGLSDVLEGASRPGHFRGVATVVLKLFGIVGPDVALFGQKDYQQQLILRRMVADLDVPVRIETVPTVREPDGLAMSSRNRYLGPEDRRAAVVLSRALRQAAEAVASGERSADRVRQEIARTIRSEPRATLDYAEIADAATLEPLARLDAARPAVALVAARVGPARLIDNAALPVMT